jgi:hypothetical protein
MQLQLQLQLHVSEAIGFGGEWVNAKPNLVLL